MSQDFKNQRTDGVEIVIELAPVPASRPRVTRWGVYYGKRYADWKKNALTFFPKIHPGFEEGELKVAVDVICKPPQRRTTDIPNGDIDNYVKAALDAVNDSGIWGDDKQVTRLNVTKRYARGEEAPRTVINIRRI